MAEELWNSLFPPFNFPSAQPWSGLKAVGEWIYLYTLRRVIDTRRDKATCSSVNIERWLGYKRDPPSPCRAHAIKAQGFDDLSPGDSMFNKRV